MQLSRQQQMVANSRRTSPTVAITRAPPATSRQRSSISSMDSAAVVSDACDEPLYSRIDHSSSNESHAAAPAMTAAAAAAAVADNHDGRVNSSSHLNSNGQAHQKRFVRNLISSALCVQSSRSIGVVDIVVARPNQNVQMIDFCVVHAVCLAAIFDLIPYKCKKAQR